MAAVYWTTSDYCNQILAEIRASNLHFIIQESRYSIYLTIRKKFTKDAPQIANAFQPQVSTDLLLQNNFEKQTAELEEARDIIKIFEDKVQNCEAELVKESNKFKETGKNWLMRLNFSKMQSKRVILKKQCRKIPLMK